jgi:DNA-binding NarL/FixJ family response regulator
VGPSSSPANRQKSRGSGPRVHTNSSNLTAFERRILSLLASGLSRTEIAAAVGRSPQTVSNVLTTTKEKLKARSLTQAAVLLTVQILMADNPSLNFR